MILLPVFGRTTYVQSYHVHTCAHHVQVHVQTNLFVASHMHAHTCVAHTRSGATHVFIHMKQELCNS
jgi:hypothetical protein